MPGRWGMLGQHNFQAEGGPGAWHALSPDKVLRRLGTNPEVGLSSDEAKRRLLTWGLVSKRWMRVAILGSTGLLLLVGNFPFF
jgi:hypothetical protein